MDLIYADTTGTDVGVLTGATLDLAYGADENDFELKMPSLNASRLSAGYRIYIEGTEYGGIVDGIKVDTDDSIVTYLGRSWHGVLDSKVIEPDSGADYCIVSGEANAVLSALIDRLSLGELFAAAAEDSGITIASYQFERYVTGYAGICAMLERSGAKLCIRMQDKMVTLSAVPVVDYAAIGAEEDSDTGVGLEVQQTYHKVNHLMCLGPGQLRDRLVINLYADAAGTISTTQTFFGVDEVIAVYENTSGSSTEEAEDIEPIPNTRLEEILT